MDPRAVRGVGRRGGWALRIQREILASGNRRFRRRPADPNGGVHQVTLTIPELSLVVLIGPSGCGKSTFAAKHFKPTEVLSSDTCRGLVSDDPNDQGATKDAFEVLRFIGSKRLEAGRLTVVDAT